MSEKIDYAAASGARQTGKTNRGNPRSWLGPALALNLVVSMAREAYDAHEQEVQIGNPGLDVRMRMSAIGGKDNECPLAF